MRRTPTLAFLLVTVFIDMLGLGIIVPIIPALMSTITGHAASGARWSGIIDSSYGVTQFCFAPFLGRIADRYGRKPVLVGSLTLLGANFLAHAMASSVAALVVAHAAAGAFAGSNIVVNAYVADVTPPQHRAKAYGQLGAAFSLGFVAGPVIGGLVGGVDVRLPFACASALAFGNALYGLLIVPESRKGDRTTPLTLRVANPFGAIADLIARPALKHLAISRLLSDIARMANQVVWTFFMVDRFGWSTGHLGIVMAGSAVATAAVQARLAAPYTRWLGERRTAIIGSVLAALDLAAFGLVPNQWLVYPLMTIGTFAAIGGVASQAWISSLAAADEQGSVQGALTGISAVAEAAVPMAAMTLFAWSLAHAFGGLTLFCAAGFAAASAVIMSRTPHKLGNHELSTVTAAAD
jgi:DHA1 family tetracycline resistance protein-like MFS transporter